MHTKVYRFIMHISLYCIYYKYFSQKINKFNKINLEIKK